MSKQKPPLGESLNFSQLILGFSSAALSYLGYNLGDSAGGIKKNLELARQNIDIIKLLKDKTQNNLTAEEQKLIDQILADLQIKYSESLK